MPELKIIPTITELFIAGTGIDIKTSYFVDELPNTISALITNSVGSQDMTSFIEGELLLQMKNSPADIDYSINANGELILVVSTGDESKYSVNANGELIYTY